ncbi:MAG: M48 family metallopeptidase [Pseudomonadota bacterium]
MYITISFIIFFIIKLVFEVYLDLRNLKHISLNSNSLPEQFINSVTSEEHLKAANYNIDKITTSFCFLPLDILILILWLFGGGIFLLDYYVSSFNFGEILTGNIYFAIFFVLASLLALPSSIYSTFVIEEKYGFNKTTKKLFFVDLLKGLGLALILGLPLLSVILFLMELMGNIWWFIAFIAFSAFQIFIMFIYPTIIAPIFNKFTPLEDGDLKEKIKELCKKCNFEFKDVFKMDASRRSSHGNAYFTSFGKNKRIVLFDTILNTLSDNEIIAILAHEIGHYKCKHIYKNLAEFLIISFIGFYLLGFVYPIEEFYYAFNVYEPSSYIAIMLFIIVVPIYTFLFTPLASWLSRRDEYEADRFAKKHANAQDLISSLITLYKDNASFLTSDPLYSKFYHSHPNIIDRIEGLK